MEYISIGISILSLGLSIYAIYKSNQYKEKEFEYKDKELDDKHFERKIANKSRLKTYGGSSGHDGEILKFKNMDNRVKIIDIDFKVDNGITIKNLNHHYKNKIIEAGEEIQLFIPRDGYQGNMDEIHYDITIYFTDKIGTPYKQRYIRQDKKVTVDEEPIEVKNYDNSINRFR